MSIDKLQDKIRKYKNPSVVEFRTDKSLVPVHIMEECTDFCHAYSHYCGELMEKLKDIVPAVRFSLSSFSLLGSSGLSLLSELMKQARKFGYYVLLDAPVSYTEKNADACSSVLLSEESVWPCDGVVLCAYIGTDAIKPFADQCKESGKDVFVVLRTGNKTAAQIQDLLTGTRLVYVAAADLVSRMGQSCIGKRNYSSVAAVSSANAADSLRTLRGKYKNLFILVDGYDYSNANAKNCSFAFDTMGHGAVVCAGDTITGAWKETGKDGEDFLEAAQEAAERMKKNLLRYITIL